MKNFFIIVILLLFYGCGNKNLNLSQENKNYCYSEPEWVYSPPHKKNRYYGVGIAGPNPLKGPQAQRKEALIRAINEIALQMRTKVDSVFVLKENVDNKKSDKYITNITFQTVNGQIVKAKILKSCINPNTGYLYVLMEAY